MRFVVFLLLVSCVQEPANIAPEPVSCPSPTPDPRLELCEQKLSEKENECNPFNGQWGACDDWVWDRWHKMCSDEFDEYY